MNCVERRTRLNASETRMVALDGHPSRRPLRKRGLLRVSGEWLRCNTSPAHPEEAPSLQAPSRRMRSCQDAPWVAVISAALLLASFLLLLLAPAPCRAWLNPTRDRIAEGNRLFKQGKFDDAIAKYGEALVDNPDSPLLNFNMGDANYKVGKYAEAMASYSRVRGLDADSKRAARTAYNVGNAQYRLGAAAEADKPEDALKAYAMALAAYRRALGADPTDEDTKFNYEFVSKKLDDLKKKLEEQKKQQQEQQQQQQEQQKQSDEQKDQEQQQPQQEDQQQARQQQGSGEQDKQQEEQQQQAAQPKSDEQKQAEQQRERAAAQQAAGGKKDQMSQQEAAALIDTAKNDELQREEFARQVQGATVAEPTQDW
jgi:Ca-activated chloride channel family protein